MKLQMLIGRKWYEIEFSAGEKRPLRSQRKAAPASVLPKLETGQDADPSVCRSPVNGIVARIHARAGDELQVNDLVLVIEAMKMETNITAPRRARVKSVQVMPGQAVKLNQVLAELE